MHPGRFEQASGFSLPFQAATAVGLFSNGWIRGSSVRRYGIAFAGTTRVILGPMYNLR